MQKEEETFLENSSGARRERDWGSKRTRLGK